MHLRATAASSPAREAKITDLERVHRHPRGDMGMGEGDFGLDKLLATGRQYLRRAITWKDGLLRMLLASVLRC